jgi:hypothetical protein
MTGTLPDAIRGDTPRVVRLRDLEPAEQDIIRSLLALKRAREAASTAKVNAPAIGERSADALSSEVGHDRPATD